MTIMESPAAIASVILAEDVEAPARHPRRWLAFSGVLAAVILDLLDSTVTNTAAPTIRADLHGSYSDLQWVTASYTMALAVALLVGGRLGDILGRQRTLVIGVAGFTLASAACAAAPAPLILILTRAAQGAFGALIMPQTVGLIRDLFPQAEAKKAWTVLGPVMSLGAVAGPIVAGALISADLLGTGWRMIFLINVPIGAFALVAVARFLPSDRRAGSGSGHEASGARLDPVSVALAAAGTFMLIFPLVQGRELGWPLWTMALLAGSLPVLLLLGWRLHRQTYRSGRANRQAYGSGQRSRRQPDQSPHRPPVTPLINVALFGRRSYAAGVAFAVVFSAAVGGSFLTINVFMQVGLGYTPLRAGLASMPWAVGAMIGSGLSGALMPRLGRRLLHLGLGGMATGLAILCVTLAHAYAGTSTGTGISASGFIVPLLAFGAGMGAIFSPMQDIILRDVASPELGSAASVLSAAQQLGLSLGIAVLGTAFFGLVAAHPAAHAATRTAAQADVLAAPLRDYLGAASGTCLISIGLIAAASLLVFLLPQAHSARQPELELSAQAL
jgi:MFS family permease